MAGLGFSGLASGLDTDLIIQSLLVNSQARADKISDSISSGNEKKKILNDIKSSLSRYSDIMEDLEEKSFGIRTITSGDTDVFEATADADSVTGDHELEVTNLAKRSVVTVGQAQTSANEIIGAGTIDLNFDNATSISVTLSDSNSTLADLAQAINDEQGDTVQASVVEVSSGSFQLVISAKDSGADLNIKDETDGGTSSSISGFDGTFLDAGQANSGGISRTQDGENAAFKLDGISITRSSNEIDDVLEGVTLTLKNLSTAPTSLKIDSDLDEVIASFDDFVNGYNEILDKIDSAIDPESDGPLRSDSDLRALKTSLQSQITRFVPNISSFNVRDDGSNGLSSLSQVGFSTDQKTGRLSIDKTEFKEALDENYDEVRNLFLGNNSSSSANSYVVRNTTSFSGSITLDTTNDTATIDGTSYNLIRTGDSLGFDSESSFFGLTFFAGASESGVNVEISAGIGSILKGEVDRLAELNGLIDDRNSTVDTRNRNLERQLDRANDRLEAERTRLTQIFAKSEQAISTLQGLQASLGAQSQF